MAKPKFSTATPIRLQDAVCKVFIEVYGAVIEEHGASYAVNAALAQSLRNKGYSIPKLQTPSAKIASTQAKRWQAKREADEVENAAEMAIRERNNERARERRAGITAADVLTVAQEEMERRRELKRERDRRHRAKKKAEKAAKQEETKS
jgi:hypothetical protein